MKREIEFAKSEFRKIKLMTGEEYVPVSELREWLAHKKVDDFPESEDYKIGYSIALDHVFMKFCKEAGE